MRKYRRIRYEDRRQIYALSKRGASQESIATVLGVSQSTVCREMCRNRGRGYRFKQAEAKAQARQTMRSTPQADGAVAAQDRGEVTPDALVAEADQRLAMRTGRQAEP
jgi:IS30 family transposase